MKSVLRHFESDGLATIVELGFVPDKVVLTLDEGTNPDILTWLKRMYDDESIYGHITTGSSGDITRATTAATGISAYDTSGEGLMIPAPNGNGDVMVIPAADFVAGATAPTARTSAIAGTVVRPSTHNGFVYECTVTDGVYGTEPTWPTALGETVSDGTNTWICREEKVKKYGKKGITIGADVTQNDNGNQLYLEAYQADKDPADIDAGDVGASLPI